MRLQTWAASGDNEMDDTTSVFIGVIAMLAIAVASVGLIRQALGLRAVLTLSPDFGTLHVGNKKFEVQRRIGYVTGATTAYSTQVSGGGGGGGTIVSGTLGTVQGSAPITSTTTRHDQLFLRHLDGRETPLELTDWSIQVHDGQLLSIVFWREKADWWPLWFIRNHTTGETFVNPSKAAPSESENSHVISTAAGCLPLIGYIILGVVSAIFWLPVLLPALLGVPTVIAWIVLSSRPTRAAHRAFKLEEMPRFVAYLDEQSTEVLASQTRNVEELSAPGHVRRADPAAGSRFCTQCGGALLPEALFCAKCGAAIAGAGSG